MLVLFLTLFVSAAEVGPAHAVSCVQQLPQGRADAPWLAADSSSHREDRAASRRALIINTKIGKANITSRPGQSGVINAILLTK